MLHFEYPFDFIKELITLIFLYLLDLGEFIDHRSSTSVCKDIRIRKLEFETSN